ncbi:hypothetical protein ABXT08_09330 [Chryseobacterium sp. NRRL B-14859]|uniref:hypothetical protein n=1 Tax=unclassified Chryseobacterium TaxID=2593645 RepID=UPI00333EEC8F
MTFLGYFAVVVVICSLYIAYRIFLKISEKNNDSGKKGSLVEKAFLVFFISLLVLSVNAMALILSYTFFWEKAYRAVNELQYEAVVVGYQKEIIKAKNFPTSAYTDKVIFFPKVEYTDRHGKKVVKTLDITSDTPPDTGKKLKVTDQKNQKNTNALELDWVMFAAGCIFTGVAAFFAALIGTYATPYPMRKRLMWSISSGIGLILINIFCVLFIYLKS